MNYNIVHQINWTIIIIMVFGYILISTIFLITIIHNIPHIVNERNYERNYENNDENNDENRNLLEFSDDDESEEDLEDELKEDLEEDLIDIRDVNENNILLSIENNYINNVEDLFDIETYN